MLATALRVSLFACLFVVLGCGTGEYEKRMAAKQWKGGAAGGAAAAKPLAQSKPAPANDPWTPLMGALAKEYVRYMDANKQGPTGWDALEKWVQANSGNVTPIQQVREGKVVVHWGVKLPDIQCGASNFVLAYLPSAPTTGGVTALLDGGVALLNPQEFQSAMAVCQPYIPKQ